ncbi:hypothetical protein CHAN_03170 [Corynebacterium hansenii]|nr:hypothetical protein CHAN_03170 [Corynebacterium hansenii]
MKLGHVYPMADIVEALLHAPTPGNEPRDVHSVDADSRGVVVGPREFCLYGPPSDGGLRADGTYLVDECPEVGDDDGEVLPEAAASAGLEFLAMGEHLDDVVHNLRHQGAPTDVATCVEAINHYLEHDAFLVVDCPSGVRALSDVVADRDLLRTTRVEAVSRVLGLSVRKTLGQEAADALLALHGHPLSTAVTIDVAAWNQWSQSPFAGRVTDGATHRLFAWGHDGDAWAVRTDDPDAPVVFFGAAGDDTAGNIVDLGVDVATFLRIADVWRALESKRFELGPDPAAHPILAEFREKVAPLVPAPADSWPWPYR